MDENGVRKYQKKEFVDEELVNKYAESKQNKELQIIEPKSNDKWLSARLAGYTAHDLCRQGMSYKVQKRAAEEFRDEQQSERETG